VKSAVLLHISPESFTKDMMEDFVVGIKETELPYEVEPELIQKAYGLGSEVQQDLIKGFLDKEHWNERHRSTLDRPYLLPEKEQRGKKKIEPMDHTVEQNPNYQLYRLLVLLAK